ncbi:MULTISPECIES: hypothetical protein [unclassified Lactobacillus]|uniref:hypothetical protein n=1 Tax=unclassified Lactobacillus TaxID=2620435 RepID=UPI002269AB30|nr:MULTISPECIES: hypothetical protein [unclassified Lactobacillus]MCX8721304.1 hypothetical protein [Lactobacillus sp. B4010]MCX8732962.1 hypothetical protein [Lactobacillus sp. B4015]MCX8735615.1 hypothetical protein [Lactobacillus sp. B4012]
MDNEEKIKISDIFLEKLTFNFSFISRKYSVEYKNLSKDNARIVLNKLVNASKLGYEVLLEQNNAECITPKEMRESMMSIPNEFNQTGRCDKCSKNYFVIKGSGIRIIGKINPISNIFYILAIDTKYELYDHGDHKGRNRH